jgi:hypothetical protein
VRRDLIDVGCAEVLCASIELVRGWSVLKEAILCIIFSLFREVFAGKERSTEAVCGVRLGVFFFFC